MSEKMFTQEEVNELVGKARKEGRESKAKEFEGWISPDGVNEQTASLNTKIAELTSALTEANNTIADNKNTIADKDKALKAHELHSVKTQIAHSKGLSFDAIDFLQGETKEDIEKSADTLKALVGSQNVPPLVNYEKSNGDGKEINEGYRNMLKGLMGE